MYIYRGEVIAKNSTTNRWVIYGNYNSNYSTLDEAKNAIDKHQGGCATARLPKRWLRDKVLKEYYEGNKTW